MNSLVIRRKDVSFVPTVRPRSLGAIVVVPPPVAMLASLPIVFVCDLSVAWLAYHVGLKTAWP